MLAVDNLFSGYGPVEALHGASLTVAAGEIVVLIGSNGAGKTTLLRAISGTQPVSGGAIRFRGEAIGRLSPHRRVARGIAHAPQGGEIFAPLSVDDNLRLGAWCRRDGNIASDIEGVYATFPDLAGWRRKSAGALPVSQRRMLAIGRALMARPKLLLLDEPSTGLAPEDIDRTFAIIAGFKRQGIALLVAEQNAFSALSIADRGYAIETGRIVLSGSGGELLADSRVRSAYLGL